MSVACHQFSLPLASGASSNRTIPTDARLSTARGGESGGSVVRVALRELAAGHCNTHFQKNLGKDMEKLLLGEIWVNRLLVLDADVRGCSLPPRSQIPECQYLRSGVTDRVGAGLISIPIWLHSVTISGLCEMPSKHFLLSSRLSLAGEENDSGTLK